LIGVGKKEGGGLSSIQNVWRERGWERPVLTEQFNPDRTILYLGMKKERNGWGFSVIDNFNIFSDYDEKQLLIDYLTDHIVRPG
jgi:hypothetical protein